MPLNKFLDLLEDKIVFDIFLDITGPWTKNNEYVSEILVRYCIDRFDMKDMEKWAVDYDIEWPYIKECFPTFF